MKRIVLQSRTDRLVLDPLCYGLSLPPVRDVAAFFALLDRFRERSSFFDSARIYGNLLQNGRGGSDALLGDYLASRGLATGAVVSTKGGHPSLFRWKGDRLDPASLQKDLEQSLRYLRRETVDVYFLHRDSGRDVADVMTTLDGFVRQGKVRFLGASNWTVPRILEANAFAETHGLAGFSIGQIQDSYATPTRPPLDPTLVVADVAERERYVHAGLPYMAFTAQARGHFSKREHGTSGWRDPYRNAVNERRFAVVKRLSEKYGVPVAAVALKPLLDAEAQVVPIVTSLDPAHLAETLRVFDFELDPEDRYALARA